MPGSAHSNPLTQSGITTSASGERHIPSSTRADGTLRKEIRVRPGYRPPEDVEVYKNKASQTPKSRGVPGASFVISSDGKSGKQTVKSTISKANLPSLAASGNSRGTSDLEKHVEPPIEQDVPLDPEAEKDKEAKKLSKRLRQARDLEQKKVKGDTLLPEQFEKVIRINELIRQLNSLGFDIDGQRKA